MEDGKTRETCVSKVTKRRAVSSLSPTKERHLQVPIPVQNDSQLRPPQANIEPKTKSSSLTRSRPPTKPPPLPNRQSAAVSKEETCLVSAAGDVLVCRSREFSQLIGVPKKRFGGLTASTSNIKRKGSTEWCELECADLPVSLEKSALCNPWITRLSSQREEKKDDETMGSPCAMRGGLRGGSTYEWEGQVPTNGRMEQPSPLAQLEFEVVNSTSNLSRVRFIEDPRVSEEERVLSMPSFDYSHFGSGGNDMVPTSPLRSLVERRGCDDSGDIDISLPLRLTHDEVKAPQTSTTQALVRRKSLATKWSAPPFFHGVPTFLTSLLQVRIEQVSAHPRGSHVLMISAEGLLFSYGLNDHGQLGIGIKSPAAGRNRESRESYIWTPTIITPLLENGGKAVTCAAGESHSLVVVSTEKRRVNKSKSQCLSFSDIESSSSLIEMNRVCSSPPSMNTERDRHRHETEHPPFASVAESVWHHQLYGFGRNNFMKIGLIHPKRKEDQSVRPQSQGKPAAASHDPSPENESRFDGMEDVLLPRRVALHCTIWPEKSSVENNLRSSHCGCEVLPPQGIFAVAASSEHSAALVRRATGDIEMYTWGNAAYHALGLSEEKLAKLTPSRVSPVPTLVEELSSLSKEDSSRSVKSLLELTPPEFPVGMSLGPHSSFLVTSKGRCLSFGMSYDGMLGHGRNVSELKSPQVIKFPGMSRTSISDVSAGTGHMLALDKSGTVWTWGKNTDGRLGLGDCSTSSASEETAAADWETAIEWTPRRLPPVTKAETSSGVRPKSSVGTALASSDADYVKVVQVCAGRDCSIFITSCGRVLSCGRHSGRLGLGEPDANVSSPTPLFGGLRLWYRPLSPFPPRKNEVSVVEAKTRPVLKRGLTLPG